MSTEVNARQVGGDHYKTGGVELWDLFGPEALVFYAARYVSRWRKKNGVEDLKKAIHVCEKLRATMMGMEPFRTKGLTDAWMRNAGLDFIERSILTRLFTYECQQDIDDVIEGIQLLIAKVPPKIELQTVHPQIIEKDVRTDTTVLPQSEMSDRLVPRQAKTSKLSPLTPWYLTNDEFASLYAGRADLAEKFYRRMGAGGRVLEPMVECRTMPKELVMCYDIIRVANGADYWIIKMASVPVDLREQYPRLKEDLNQYEYDIREEWQRHLYDWSDADQKWVIRDRSWGKGS